MLTKAQIQRMAQRYGVGLQPRSGTICSTCSCGFSTRRSQELIFKGGTALRMVYGGPRYSEDLDFNGQGNLAALQLSWKEIVSRLGDFGVTSEMRREWVSDVGYSFDVSFQGPLFDGRNRSKGKVRVDVNPAA